MKAKIPILTAQQKAQILGMLPVQLRSPAKRHGKPMSLRIFLDLFRHRQVGRPLAIQHIYHRVAHRNSNLVITKKLFDRLRKLYGDTLPNNQRIIISVEGPLARRAGYRLGQLRKAHVIHSMNEFLDLFFHAAD